MQYACFQLRTRPVFFFLSGGVSQTDDAVSVSSDSLGEQLYDLIDLFNTGHTQKITGKSVHLPLKVCNMWIQSLL